eukprot:485209_1
MSGRYRLLTRIRKSILLYRPSNTSRNPFRYLFRPQNDQIQLNNELEEINAKQSNVLSNQWSHYQNKWNKLKNRWLDARSKLVHLNDIDSDYVSRHLLSDMDEDDPLKSKWAKFTKKKLLRLGNASMKNKIDIYHRGESFFEALWNDIEKAEHQILMETYIIEPDLIAIKTIKLLAEASLRGVSVTLIVDGFGSSNMNVDTNDHLNELRRSGAVVLEYNKVNWTSSRLFEFFIERRRFLFAYRNHKKIIVIDDKYGYTGGMNISGEYCGFDINPPGINKFRDTHCRLEGDIVRYLKESLYFSVLDINPTIPPTQFMESDDDDEDDTDIESDADETEGHTIIDKQHVIKRDTVEYEVYDDGALLVEREDKDMRQRLFPYQMLPACLKPLNAYKKYMKQKKEQEYATEEVITDEDITENDENILFGRKRIWNERWKNRKKGKRNLYDETYKNRLKILASSPRKSLSEWMEYYEHGQGKEEKNEASVIQNKSILEVAALSNLMDEAKQTKNFCYSHTDSHSDMGMAIALDQHLYIQVLESYRDKRFRFLQKALMSAIDNAESHIFIMNPYFLPPLKLKKRLRNASERGVDIRVITCDQSDVPLISMAGRHIYDELLSKDNIRLFEYGGSGDGDDNECANILHGKMCLIDDVFVSLGSFNWDDWSYTKNLEMNLMIVDHNVAKSVHEQFIIDQDRSKEIMINNVRNDRSWLQKCLYYGAYLTARMGNRLL